MHTVSQTNELRCDYVTLLHVQLGIFVLFCFPQQHDTMVLKKAFTETRDI